MIMYTVLLYIPQDPMVPCLAYFLLVVVLGGKYSIRLKCYSQQRPLHGPAGGPPAAFPAVEYLIDGKIMESAECQAGSGEVVNKQHDRTEVDRSASR